MEKRPDFYKGVDISFLPQCLDAGMKVKDLDGKEMEPFDLLQKYGVNAVRLRIWHTPGNVPESGGYCDLAHTISMAEKIKKYGMQFMLDFHYSDFWADPGHQQKPKAWEGLEYRQLKDAVFAYTRDTLLALQEKGVLPDIVQIGNEIRSGLLFPEGELPDYAGMTGLVNEGIRAARSVADSSKMQIMIHLDQGGRYFYLKEWFQHAFEEGLMDFDLIGLSYYPFWHGTYTDLKETMERLVKDYGKPIMIVESAYAWRKCENGFIDEAQEKIAGFPASPEGQHKVLDLVNGIVASLPGQMGMGVFYWEPLCLPVNGVGAWAENMGLLDESGRVLEGIHAFEFTREKYDPMEWAKVYEPQEITVGTGKQVTLPEEVSVLLMNGTLQRKRVKWQTEASVSFEKSGSFIIQGLVQEKMLPVSVSVRVTESDAEKKNLLKDVNWDEGMVWWQTESSGEHLVAQIYPDFVEPYPAPPVNALRVEGKQKFSYRICQQVRIMEAGDYCFEVEMQGTDTTGVSVFLFVKTEKEEKKILVHPTEHGFVKCRLEGIRLDAEPVTVGVSISASPMYVMMRRFSFYRMQQGK